MSEQLGLFGAAKGDAAKEEAIERVRASADPSWMNHAWAAIVMVCHESHAGWTTITSDLVWERLAEWHAPKPHEPRAMGPVMRRAVKEGLLRPTSTFRPSAMPQNHRRPVRVYEVRRG